jgi:hypothetical protein
MLLFLVLSACRKRDMQVATGEVSDVLYTTAKITGQLISTGDGIKQYGHCYSKDPGPTISDTKTDFGVAIGLGAFTSFLQGLEPGTEYYAKAYVSRGNTTVYGQEISFTTLLDDTTIEITTTAVSAITDTSAISGGTITNLGGIPVIARGVCWSVTTGPTIDNYKTNDGSGTGVFSSLLAGLTANMTYYIRAYALKSTGTVYGNELSFKTGK